MKKQLLVALFSISQFAMASQSIEKLEADCLNHQDVACVRLGYLYLTGNGVAVSAIKASDCLNHSLFLNNRLLLWRSSFCHKSKRLFKKRL